MSSERSDGRQARLVVRVLGTCDLVLDGDRLGVSDTLRVQRLVGLLSIREAPQHRARLAYELWPDSAEGQARTNLRKLLH